VHAYENAGHKGPTCSGAGHIGPKISSTGSRLCPKLRSNLRSLWQSVARAPGHPPSALAAGGRFLRLVLATRLAILSRASLRTFSLPDPDLWKLAVDVCLTRDFLVGHHAEVHQVWQGLGVDSAAREFGGMPVSDDLLVGSDGEWVTVMHGRVMLARFPGGDLGMRNLAVVSLTNTRLGCKEVADAFDLSATYVSVLRRRVRDEGSAGLSRDMGRPVAIDAAGEATAVRMRASGKTHAEIGACLDVDPTTVGRLLGRLAAAPVQPDQLPLVDPDPDLETEDNDNDNDSDNDGDADGAGGRPVGVRLCRYAGVALLFAFMERVGFDKVFKMRTPAGCRYDSTAVLAGTAAGFLLGVGNVEGFKHLNRVDLGALVGLDRFPTTRTLRGRLGEIGDTVNAVDLQARLAKALLDFDGPQFDLFFVDDHFVTYSGAAPLAKGPNNRKGRAEHGRDDTWVTDSAGRPLVCVSGEPSGLTQGLKAIIGPLRNLSIGDCWVSMRIGWMVC